MTSIQTWILRSSLVLGPSLKLLFRSLVPVIRLFLIISALAQVEEVRALGERLKGKAAAHASPKSKGPLYGKIWQPVPDEDVQEEESQDEESSAETSESGKEASSEE